jgi:NAD(P)-dependent dehydrogenase (short-subunit alcohol dehydrogenase family)
MLSLKKGNCNILSTTSGTAGRAGRLQDKVALVTGAAHGIGAAVARIAAAEGARLAVLDYDADGITAIASELAEAGAIPIQADISDLDAIDRAVTTVVDTHGRLDVLISVAGVIDQLEPIESVTPETWDRVFDINVRGTAFLIQRALREMLPQSAGSIVNTSSTAALIGGGGGSAYIASKGALASLTRQIAWEIGDRGIRVNAIAPGVTTTNAAQNATRLFGSQYLSPAGEQMWKKAIAAMHSPGHIPLGRAAEPDEIARAAVFLASDDASYLTGSLLIVDGGLTIH